jgi:transcriptional regulator with XRE-family HTH domain
MKYPRFAAALRQLAPTLREIADLIGRSERQVSYYLTGNAMPPADITARVPELHAALRRDLGIAEASSERHLIAA